LTGEKIMMQFETNEEKEKSLETILMLIGATLVPNRDRCYDFLKHFRRKI
jgi:hypothetical protein